MRFTRVHQVPTLICTHYQDRLSFTKLIIGKDFGVQGILIPPILRVQHLNPVLNQVEKVHKIWYHGPFTSSSFFLLLSLFTLSVFPLAFRGLFYVICCDFELEHFIVSFPMYKHDNVSRGLSVTVGPWSLLWT